MTAQLAFLTAALSTKRSGAVPCRSPLSAARGAQCPRQLVVAKMEGDRGSSGAEKRSARQTWPIGRFFRDLVFFTPLGEVFNPRQGASPAQTSANSTIAMNVTSAPASQTLTADAPSRRDGGGAVLVTGATGGVGRRVVRELVRRGHRVRALVRSDEHALQSALDDDESFRAVEVQRGSLESVGEEQLRGVRAVLSCTGARERRADGGSGAGDARKDEFAGVSNLLKAFSAASERDGGGDTGGAGDDVLVSFSDEAELKRLWGAVDDVVMGGVSRSGISVVDEGGRALGRFGGEVSSANNGGFASVRTRALPAGEIDIGRDAAGFQLRVRGDGQRYKFQVRCDDRWDGTAYCHSFDTVAGEFVDVRVPFDELLPVFRARVLRDGAKFDPHNVRAFQIMLSKFEYDGELNPSFRTGEFQLDIERVSTYSRAPKLVFCSLAGVTRVLKPSEADDPGAQAGVNASSGRVLEWKFAAEDAVRASGLPYVIVRPVELNDDEGTGRVRYSQGDTLSGGIARDDVAKVMVDVLEHAAQTNVTFEVSNAGDVTRFGAALRELEPDDPRHRSFAPFPFVPSE